MFSEQTRLLLYTEKSNNVPQMAGSDQETGGLRPGGDCFDFITFNTCSEDPVIYQIFEFKFQRSYMSMEFYIWILNLHENSFMLSLARVARMDKNPQ